MRKCSAFVFVFVLFLAGCVQDHEISMVGESERNTGNTPDLTSEELRALSILTSDSHGIGMDEVALKAQDAISFLSEYDAATRSNLGRRTIGGISVITKPESSTRDASNDQYVPDTMAYVVNFADDMGFAIVSGDNRIPAPILAIVGSGNLGDSTDNPGLALFLSGAENYIMRSVEEYETKKDSLAKVILEKIQPSDPETGEPVMATRASLPQNWKYLFSTGGRIIISSSVIEGASVTKDREAPMLPVEWGQGFPYNNLVKGYASDNDSPAGCVATAAAQLMAYWKYPTKIDGYEFDWDVLRTYSGSNAKYTGPNKFKPLDYASSSVAILMERIGRKVNMHYGTAKEGSGAYVVDVLKMLRSMGYAMSPCPYPPNFGGNLPFLYWRTPYDYDCNRVIMALKDKRPVLTSGYRSETKYKILGVTYKKVHANGHAWVMDGYIKRQKDVTYKIVYRQGMVTRNVSINDHVNEVLIHQNWGWDGLHNGFYASGCFDVATKEEPSTATRSDAEPNYQYEVKTFPYIQK